MHKMPLIYPGIDTKRTNTSDQEREREGSDGRLCIDHRAAWKQCTRPAGGG